MNTTMNESEPRVELALPEPAPLTLFGTSEPRLALARMADMAQALMDVIEDRNRAGQKLSTRISGKAYLHAEAWTTLGGMLGVVPIVAWTRPNETGDGYVARVEARTLAGVLVGAAEAECSRAEERWRAAMPHAIRAMAQTRAVSRALRAPLGQIVVLAGYEAASVDEADVVETPAPPSPAPPPPSPPPPRLASREQLLELATLMDELEQIDQGTDWGARSREIAGVQSASELTPERADFLRGRLLEIKASLT